MKYIAHRGNLAGPDPTRENTIAHIVEALNRGFEVEADAILGPDGEFWFGHGAPQETVPSSLVYDPRMWFHAKDVVTLGILCNLGARCFAHETDPVVLTSDGIPWVYPGKPICKGAVVVLPERAEPPTGWKDIAYGVCTDYALDYRDGRR